MDVTQWACKSIFMCSAPCVALLFLPVLMSCQSQHHSHIRSDTSFIFPVLLLISLFSCSSLAGSWHQKTSSPSSHFYPTFIPFFPPSLSCAPVLISLWLHASSCTTRSFFNQSQFQLSSGKTGVTSHVWHLFNWNAPKINNLLPWNSFSHFRNVSYPDGMY